MKTTIKNGEWKLRVEFQNESVYVFYGKTKKEAKGNAKKKDGSIARLKQTWEWEKD